MRRCSVSRPFEISQHDIGDGEPPVRLLHLTKAENKEKRKKKRRRRKKGLVEKQGGTKN